MHYQQLAMLAVEAAVMALVVLGLFRVRTVLGLTPLSIVLGGLQYLEATLTLRVELLPGVWLLPASTVLFPATLVSVLLIYVKEDAIGARKLVYGLVLANAVASLVSLLIGYHLTIGGSVSTSLSAQDFFGSAWISAVGTSLLFLDVLGIILCYELIGRYTRGLFAPFLLSLLTVLAVDNFLFNGIVYGDSPELAGLLIWGFAGKAATAVFYSIVSWAYLRFAEPRTAVVGTGDVADVFHRLTYRQKYEQVRQRMVRDALTGLFNRGYFDETLPRAMDDAKHRGEALSLVIVDLDRFKEINDGLSHLAGDRALQLVARTISANSRANDVPCRYGGDEFVVLLPSARATAAAEFAERFRQALQADCQSADPPYAWGYLSTTIGVATYPLDQEIQTPEDLLRVADRRLYDGKHAGRGCVVTADQHVGATF